MDEKREGGGGLVAHGPFFIIIISILRFSLSKIFIYLYLSPRGSLVLGHVSNFFSIFGK